MTRNERIRFIYLKQRRFTRAGASAALGKSLEWVERCRFSRENGGWVSWQEMVLMANLLWTRLQVKRALGDDFQVVFPERAQLVPITIYVPEYKAISLRRQARRRRRDISQIMTDAIDVGWCEARSMDRTVPGYLTAWHFPYPIRDAKHYAGIQHGTTEGQRKTGTRQRSHPRRRSGRR